MRTKCYSCLCSTCVSSCKCSGCKGKTESCEKYIEFQQLSIFGPQRRYKTAPRKPLAQYGISNARKKELTAAVQSGEYTSLARSAAHEANEDIAEYILLSVKQKLSYESMERLWDLKKIKRMACGRSDFYGYQRLFYHLFDEKIKEGH